MWLTGIRIWQDGETPLDLAAEEGHKEIVGALMKAGADKEAKEEVRWGREQGELGEGRCGSDQCFEGVGTG